LTFFQQNCWLDRGEYRKWVPGELPGVKVPDGGVSNGCHNIGLTMVDEVALTISMLMHKMELELGWLDIKVCIYPSRMMTLVYIHLYYQNTLWYFRRHVCLQTSRINTIQQKCHSQENLREGHPIQMKHDSDCALGRGEVLACVGVGSKSELVVQQVNPTRQYHI
jgi:hypothetical protein